MKLRTIISEDADEEITLVCRERDERILFLEDVIRNAIGRDSELLLNIGHTEYFIAKKDILFFESTEGKIMAHTADNIYTTSYKLYELEQLLPPFFARASKSCIINTAAIRFCGVRTSFMRCVMRFSRQALTARTASVASI